jgi:hypothetical protein
MQDVCLHVSARLESNDSGLIYMTFWKGAVRRQRKTDCLDCAFSPATTALFTVLLQKLASAAASALFDKAGLTGPPDLLEISTSSARGQPTQL